MKSRYVLVLARSPQAAAIYARRAGLERFSFRAVSSASSIRGIQVADVHVLPDFAERRDSHAILAELRYGRDIKMINVEMPSPLEAPAVDQGDGFGEQLTLDALYDVAAPSPRRHKTVDPVIELVPQQSAAESLAHVGPAEDIAAEQAAEAGPKVRRKRCATCGRLVTGDTDPAHDSAAHTGAPMSKDGFF